MRLHAKVGGPRGSWGDKFVDGLKLILVMSAVFVEFFVFFLLGCRKWSGLDLHVILSVRPFLSIISRSRS